MKQIKYIILLLIVFGITNCKKREEIPLSEVLILHSWRNTETAMYDSKDKFEKYTYLFDDASLCKKNSYIEMSKLSRFRNNYGYYEIINLCNMSHTWIDWTIKNDSFFLKKYGNDTILKKRKVESYTDRSFTLRYDTIINNNKKIIRETYDAFTLLD